MTKVSEIMTRGVRTLPPTANLVQAAQAMDALDVGSLPVCDGDGVVVDIRDPDVRVEAGGHFVHVANSGDTRADVDELGDAGVHHFPDRSAQEPPDLPCQLGHVGFHGDRRLGDLAVNAEVVRAAEEVVPDPGRAGTAEVQPDGRPFRVVRAHVRTILPDRCRCDGTIPPYPWPFAGRCQA